MLKRILIALVVIIAAVAVYSKVTAEQMYQTQPALNVAAPAGIDYQGLNQSDRQVQRGLDVQTVHVINQ